MTTPEAAGLDLPTAPTSPFDVTALTALANEFFRTLPGHEAAAVMPSASPSVAPAAPAGAPTPTWRTAIDPPSSALPPQPPVPLGVAAPASPATWGGAAPAAVEPPPSAGQGTSSPVPMPTDDQLAVVAALFVGVPDAQHAPSVPDGATTSFVEPGGARSLLDPAGIAPSPESARTQTPTAAAFVPSVLRAETVGFSPSLVSVLPRAGAGFDPHLARADFPILREQVHGRRLVWLDNAATTQKPTAVIERLTHFYEHENSNIHRAAHTLAARATDAYESARETVRRFLNAASTDEIVFVRGTTEAINLVAQSWGRATVGEGDEILVTHLEHHANIVPWQQLCAQTGATLAVAPVDDNGDVILSEYERRLTPRTKLVAFTQVSNALGTVTPAAEMIALAHRHGIPVLLDGAQSVAHLPVDVQALDVDFFVLSGHKVFAPTGIGVLYGKRELLESMPPWQGGGNMIADVRFDRTEYQGPPARFEAGTGTIADAVGLGAALDYLTELGLPAVGAYEHELLGCLLDGLGTVPGLRVIGAPRQRAGLVSFVLEGWRTEDVGAALDREGIAVRSGHHCAQPILRRFGLEATVRPSLALYNTTEDVDALVDALHRLVVGRPW